MKTFDNFLAAVEDLYDESWFFRKSGLRRGQTIMNVLYEFWPEKHKEILGGDHDCFYNESRVELTLEKLKSEWLENPHPRKPMEN